MNTLYGAPSRVPDVHDNTPYRRYGLVYSERISILRSRRQKCRVIGCAERKKSSYRFSQFISQRRAHLQTCPILKRSQSLHQRVRFLREKVYDQMGIGHWRRTFLNGGYVGLHFICKQHQQLKSIRPISKVSPSLFERIIRALSPGNVYGNSNGENRAYCLNPRSKSLVLSRIKPKKQDDDVTASCQQDYGRCADRYPTPSFVLLHCRPSHFWRAS